ncbi:MAG TPA: methyltransferase domain-containing protein [Anaerolineae bacterium]|jgi:SAM-dependent methyltransferase|nr:methyltransferase domain-containing protein [Anaerolineae bacterium]
MGELPKPLCDYEDYDYQGSFWAAGRSYEDAVERIALKRLLPPTGERLVEIGAAYGRLADLYAGYQQVVLLDPAKSQLRQAQERLAGDSRYIYVVGDVYRLPLSSASFDVALTVRVLHHLTDLPAAFEEIHRILRPQGRYILEYPNKRNLKEILRYLARRSHRQPFSPEPVEFAPLNFDFHPSYVEKGLRRTALIPERSLAVSSLRLDLFKRFLPLSWLIRVDQLLQSPTAPLRLAPSIFLLTRAQKEVPSSDRLFRCPACGGEELEESRTGLSCPACGRVWPVEDGIYDFGSPKREGPQG